MKRRRGPECSISGCLHRAELGFHVTDSTVGGVYCSEHGSEMRSWAVESGLTFTARLLR